MYWGLQSTVRKEAEKREEEPLFTASERARLNTFVNCAERLHHVPSNMRDDSRAMFEKRDLEKGLARMRELDALIAAENKRLGRPPKAL